MRLLLSNLWCGAKSQNRSFHLAAQFIVAAKPFGVWVEFNLRFSRPFPKDDSSWPTGLGSCIATVEDFVDSGGLYLPFSPSRYAIASSSTLMASATGTTGRASNVKAGNIEQNL